jgi:hypothetical protein
MQRYRNLLWAAAILLIGALGLVVVVESRAHCTPLSVGATADEAWTYIHSDAACRSRGFMFDVTRVSWQAHARDIQCDVRYSLHWTTNSLFAIRHVVYGLDTNGTISGIRSSWKWNTPFVSASGTAPGPILTNASWRANAPYVFEHRHPDGVPGPVIPLAPGQLLGAKNALERDEVAEAVARYYAKQPQPAWKQLADKPKPAWIFVGFRDYRLWEGILREADCDFSPQLLRRLSDLKSRFRAVSSAEWGRYDPRNGFVESDDSARGITCIIQRISLVSMNEAEVEVRSTSGFYSRTLISNYQLVLRSGKWKVISVKVSGVAKR